MQKYTTEYGHLFTLKNLQLHTSRTVEGVNGKENGVGVTLPLPAD